MDSSPQPPKKHKKHKREKEEQPSLKLILKVSPEENSADVDMDESSQHSSLFAKKAKKKKKDKKHKKKHHKDKKRRKEEESGEAPAPKKQKFLDKAPFQKLLDYLVRTLEKKDDQQFFAWPVTDKIAPGYSSLISTPMDFSTMKSKIENEQYSSLNEFTADFSLMCTNAMTYNAPDTIYYKAAKKLHASGLKILSPEKIKMLLPLMPSIRLLTEETLGGDIFDKKIKSDNSGGESSEDELEIYCADVTKSVHYMPPHPLDPPDPCGAFTDDLATEEVLLQARLAAREAAHRLATKKPNAKMGLLRQKPDGSTSLAILTPTNGVLPGTKELPISLGTLSGKLNTGTAMLTSYKDPKVIKAPRPLSYGAFSSFAPSHDSTFASLNPEEALLVSNTYGDELGSQYAESLISFTSQTPYATQLVDSILNTITKGDHSKTIIFITDRKHKDEAEKFLHLTQTSIQSQLESEWDNATLNSLKSLEDLGIDTSFLDGLTQIKLDETADLLENLAHAQNARLVQPPLGYAVGPSDKEYELAGRITENLTQMAKNLKPADLVSGETIRGTMGIEI